MLMVTDLPLVLAAIILAHNHPSGDVKPSQADKSLTKQISEACRMVGITLHDHIIIGARGDFTSFKQQGLLQG